MRREETTATDQSSGPVEVPLNDWTRSVDAFVRMIDRLQADYAELEARYAALNAELASVNDTLRAAGEANQRLATFLEQIVSGVTSGIIAVDAAGIVRLFNPAASHLLSMPVADVINRPYLEIWPGRAGDTATAAACASRTAPVTDVRREITAADGRSRVLSVSTVRLDLFPENGAPASAGAGGGAIEVFSDITQMETMQAEVLRMRTLAVLGEMSATIAHEIRNPLGGVIGFAELLARRTDGDPHQREMVEKILTGAQHLNGLVERLLEFAREPRLDRRPLQWDRFFHSTLDQFEENAKRRGARLTLVRSWPEKLPAGRADGLCLRQAIWNILENAEQATDGQGRVEVAAEPLSCGGIRFRVFDNGRGVDPKIADRIFSPFITTRQKGTGLGLATSRKFVEAHGGTIGIESHPGAGTIVTVELPNRD